MIEDKEVSEQDIAQRAYELYVRRGGRLEKMSRTGSEQKGADWRSCCSTSKNHGGPLVVSRIN